MRRTCVQAGGDDVECFWVVTEDEDSKKRDILWLVGGYKSIPESAGPAAVDCPEFFFELVPEAQNKEWREDVRKFWVDSEN